MPKHRQDASKQGRDRIDRVKAYFDSETRKRERDRVDRVKTDFDLRARGNTDRYEMRGQRSPKT